MPKDFETEPNRDIQARINQLKHDAQNKIPLLMHKYVPAKIKEIIRKKKKREVNTNFNRLRGIVLADGIAPHQILQVLHLARTSGISSASLYSLALSYTFWSVLCLYTLMLKRQLSFAHPALSPFKSMESILQQMQQEKIALSSQDYLTLIRSYPFACIVLQGELIIQTLQDR